MICRIVSNSSSVVASSISRSITSLQNPTETGSSKLKSDRAREPLKSSLSLGASLSHGSLWNTPPTHTLLLTEHVHDDSPEDQKRESPASLLALSNNVLVTSHQFSALRTAVSVAQPLLLHLTAPPTSSTASNDASWPPTSLSSRSTSASFRT